MTALGIQSEPIYMLADENMAEDEFRHYRVQGLGIGTQDPLGSWREANGWQEEEENDEER